MESTLKLHLGCGQNCFKGWVNIDIDSSKADFNHDLTMPLPYKDNSVDYIYNEHFIEHLTVHQGVNFLIECHRVLKPEGILRIATPNVTYALLRYFFFWRKQGWIDKYGYGYLKTRAEMINLVFHEWGHQYLYNKEELTRRLKESGFQKINKAKRNKSKFSVFRNIETRKESTLILEAIKSSSR